MTGTELNTLITSVNGGNSIDITLGESLVKVAKSIIEGERDWMPLRKTDTSISFLSGSTWQTAYSLAGITDFLRFYGDFPIRIFDGANRIDQYRQVPFEQRLEYKDMNGTFVYDESNNSIYFNGTNNMAGTVYLSYIKDTPAIELDTAIDLKTAGTFVFPDRFHPLLAFYIVGISKGAIDYDDINRSMLPANQATLVSLKNSMVDWDNKKQLISVENTDPYRGGDSYGNGYASNRININ